MPLHSSIFEALHGWNRSMWRCQDFSEFRAKRIDLRSSSCAHTGCFSLAAGTGLNILAWRVPAPVQCCSQPQSFCQCLGHISFLGFQETTEAIFIYLCQCRFLDAGSSGQDSLSCFDGCSRRATTASHVVDITRKQLSLLVSHICDIA